MFTRHGFFLYPSIAYVIFFLVLYKQKNMRSSTRFILFILCTITISACEFKCSVGNNSEKVTKGKTVSSSTTVKDGTSLTNNITLSAKGVSVKKATLLLPNNEQVSDDNMVNVNEKIKLVLFIEDGWKIAGGKSFIGAAEKITGSDGQVIVDAQDLFSDYTNSGMNPEDAKVVSLSAIITQVSSTASSYTVSFRVWDKISDAEINGSYTFYIKKS